MHSDLLFCCQLFRLTDRAHGLAALDLNRHHHKLQVFKHTHTPPRRPIAHGHLRQSLTQCINERVPRNLRFPQTNRVRPGALLALSWTNQSGLWASVAVTSLPATVGCAAGLQQCVAPKTRRWLAPDLRPQGLPPSWPTTADTCRSVHASPLRHMSVART